LSGNYLQKMRSYLKASYVLNLLTLLLRWLYGRRHENYRLPCPIYPARDASKPHPITENLTATWTAQRMVEAFLFDTAPRYLLRDRDKIYGVKFCSRVQGLGIEEVLIALRSPW
jgi:hypothetical protein